jgi:hypothetical protein
VEHGSHIKGRILRKIFGPKWDKLTEALRNISSSKRILLHGVI